MKFRKFTNNGFKIVIRRKTRHKRSLFPLNVKTILNRVLSTNEILVVQVEETKHYLKVRC